MCDFWINSQSVYDKLRLLLIKHIGMLFRFVKAMIMIAALQVGMECSTHIVYSAT